jgi:Rod binding domain-containing protein
MSSNITPVLGAHSPSRAVHDPRAEKVQHAAAEFESILVKQLLKAAKLGGSGGDEKANGYADMAVDALASAIEQGGGLGLARRIQDAISTGPHAVQAQQAVATPAGAAREGG